MSIDSASAKREYLRHAVATLAYRGGKALRGAPDTFASFKISETSRTPGKILTHMCDLLDWALSLARGAQVWNDSTPAAWNDDVRRFFEALGRFDEFLASDAPLAASPEQLFQGPIADALTHVGQIAMLRRAAGSPMKGENYFRADVAIGRVGTEQTPPRREFD